MTTDNDTTEKLLKLMSSENDSDALMGFRGFQALLKGEGVDVAEALRFVIGNLAALKAAKPQENDSPAPARPALMALGSPQCVAEGRGGIMLVRPGDTGGEVVALPGAAAAENGQIALCLKDALVAAAINKSRFKLKLVETSHGHDSAETTLRAEYEREGMAPVPIWTHNAKGEVATLATVLRRAVSSVFPDYVAA